VFYIQGRKDDQLVTLIVEKQQIQSLAIGLEEFLSKLHEGNPEMPESTLEYDEKEMELEQPLNPLFRVGQLGLGYDEESDLLLLVAKETPVDDEESEDANVARFWCTRSQLRMMCRWGLDVARKGRPICGNCGEPIDAEGHFCPKSNGHKH
jgi:uncharacterized repeat protein (TIGR03847 family)